MSLALASLFGGSPPARSSLWLAPAVLQWRISCMCLCVCVAAGAVLHLEWWRLVVWLCGCRAVVAGMMCNVGAMHELLLLSLSCRWRVHVEWDGQV